MKKIIGILFILIFQSNLLAQKRIVGIVEYYRINPTEDRFTMSTSKTSINSLNSRIHKIKINQDGIVNDYETNENGIFNVIIQDSEKVEIIVNDFAKLLKKSFIYKTQELKDTVFLRISDRKIANYIDSISAPKFYKEYNEKQAYLDFKNGKKRILTSGGWLTAEAINRRKELSLKYGIKFENLFGCIIQEPQVRIMNRYNEAMRKLIGIEDMW